MPKTDNGQLFVVVVDGGSEFDDAPEVAACKKLGTGLYLVESESTQSQLYHAVKRRAAPEALFVGALADVPKFKGMSTGSLRWLREAGTRE